jgi:hypothetical protein
MVATVKLQPCELLHHVAWHCYTLEIEPALLHRSVGKLSQVDSNRQLQLCVFGLFNATCFGIAIIHPHGNETQKKLLYNLSNTVLRHTSV